MSLVLFTCMVGLLIAPYSVNFKTSLISLLAVAIGSYISVVGLAVFLINLLYAFAKKKKAEQNPWGEGATTLEWTVSSPPPFHTFEELPKVK